MNQKGRKLQPKLHLDMGFGEALARFTQTDPAELSETQGMRDGDITYLPRIAAADFEAFRGLMKDDIAPTFEIWSERYKERLTYWGNISRVVEVDVHPDKFSSFCHRHSRGHNAKSLYDFAADIGESKG
jgi:hypothetical protein